MQQQEVTFPNREVPKLASHAVFYFLVPIAQGFVSQLPVRISVEITQKIYLLVIKRTKVRILDEMCQFVKESTSEILSKFC